MKILNNLTIKNLKLNKKRTIVTIIGIILSTALMAGIGLLFSSFRDYMIREIQEYQGSYHAYYQNISKEQLNEIEKEKLSYFYEKGLGFTKIDSENKYKPYLYISSVNKKFFSELDLIEGKFPQNANEIVISSHLSTNGGVSYQVGDTITLEYGHRYFENEEIYENSMYYEGESLVVTSLNTYKIVGIVERSSYEDYSAAGYTVFTLNENVEDNANIYITFNKASKIMKQSKDLAKEINYNEAYINYNYSLLALYGESGYGNIMSSMISMLIIMLALVSIGCVIVIYNSFAISVMERKRQFGLLSSIGATKRQLSYMIIFEAGVVGIIGIILGIAGAYLGIGTVIVILNNLLEGTLGYKLNLVTTPAFIIIPIIFMIIVILVSAIIPSRRASKVSPIEAIRQNDDIKVNKKKIRTNKLINKLFGIEGEIALKNIKRNKKKYRVTTISLFISIVLFISFSAYMKYTLNTADSLVETFNYDISINVYDQNIELEDKVNQILNSRDVKDYTKYKSVNIPILRTVTYTDDYIKYSKERFGASYDELFANNKYDYIEVIILDDNSYNKYKENIGLNEDKVILLNNFKGTTYTNNKRVGYDIDVIKDEKVKLSLCNFSSLEGEEPDNAKEYCKKNLNNIFLTDKNYYLTDEFSYVNNYKLIVNQRIFDAIMSDIEYESDYYFVNIKVDNYENIDKIGAELNKMSGAYYNNIKENTKMESNLILAVKILMYGFISLVTLIGVTSVFNTISTSIALRKKEFAILRSIGLTKNGFNKMLFFESLFFGLKSLIFALPVSFIIILLIHMSLSDMLSISSLIIPWSSIIIAIVMVFVIILITMMYSANKIKKHNIIEQIREENI